MATFNIFNWQWLQVLRDGEPCICHMPEKVAPPDHRFDPADGGAAVLVFQSPDFSAQLGDLFQAM